MKRLTVIEETVMLAVYRLKKNAYSVTIHREILEMTGKDDHRHPLQHAQATPL
ncbi:MAG: hypothetical protein ABIL68_12560 [bacterium]